MSNLGAIEESAKEALILVPRENLLDEMDIFNASSGYDCLPQFQGIDPASVRKYTAKPKDSPNWISAEKDKSHPPDLLELGEMMAGESKVRQETSEALLAEFDELMMAEEPKFKQETSETILAELDELLIDFGQKRID